MASRTVYVAYGLQSSKASCAEFGVGSGFGGVVAVHVLHLTWFKHCLTHSIVVDP